VPENRITSWCGPLLAARYDSAEFKRRFRIRDKMVLFLGRSFLTGFRHAIGGRSFGLKKYPDQLVLLTSLQLSRRQILSLGTTGSLTFLAWTWIRRGCTGRRGRVHCVASRGIGGVYIEAWAMKKPVIACRILSCH
jgi:hypothetical protein